MCGASGLLEKYYRVSSVAAVVLEWTLLMTCLPCQALVGTYKGNE